MGKQSILNFTIVSIVIVIATIGAVQEFGKRTPTESVERMDIGLSKERPIDDIDLYVGESAKLIDGFSDTRICFNGFLNDNLLAFELYCGFRESNTVFLMKDKFPHVIKMRGHLVELNLIDSSSGKIKLEMSLKFNSVK